MPRPCSTPPAGSAHRRRCPVIWRIDPARGSVLARHGKGDKRREVGMDPFGFAQLAAWQAHRVLLPPEPLFCVIDGQTRGRRWAADRRPRRAAGSRGSGRGQTALRAPSAQTRPRRRTCPRRRRGQHHPTSARTHRPGDHLDLSTGDRPDRDHRHRPYPPTTHDPDDRWPGPVADQLVDCRSTTRRVAERQPKPERSAGDDAGVDIHPR